MSPTLRALLYEFGRTWRDLVFRLALGVGFVIFDYYLIHNNALDIMDFRGSMLMLLVWNAIPSNATANDLSRIHVGGFSLRLWFTRPISTLQLVIVPMLFCVAAGLVCFLFSASLFFWLLETSFPLAGPSAFAVCVTCCCFAFAWSTATVTGRWITFVLTNVALFALCMAGFSEIGEPAYWDFPWFVYVGLALLSLIAFAFTVLGVQRRRWDESLWACLGFTSVVQVLASRWRKGRRNQSLSQDLLAAPFRNPWIAHCWYEFHRIGRLMIYAVLLVPMVILALVAIGNYVDPDVEACLGTFAGSLALCPFIYQVFGMGAATGLRLHDGAISFLPYDATIPMRCDHLIAMKLLLVTAWTLVGWLLMAGALALYSPYIGDGVTLTKLSEELSATDGDASAYWWVAGAIIAMPLLMSTTPLLVMLGYFTHNPLHPLRSGCAMIFVVVHLVIFVFDIVGRITGEVFGAFLPGALWLVYGYLLPVIITGWCVSALKKSIGSEFVGKPYLIVTLSLWVVFVCTMVALAIMLSSAIPTSIPVWAYFVGVAVLLAPLAATIAAPMEMAAHRHA
ncbi:MAG: hypothetical protein H8E66_33355 [Planctomycetes bacterium]|nr:hypothetical protein [Planctomycetota bacterium]